MNSIIIKRYNAYMYFTDTDSLSDKQYDLTRSKYTEHRSQWEWYDKVFLYKLLYELLNYMFSYKICNQSYFINIFHSYFSNRGLVRKM